MYCWRKIINDKKDQIFYMASTTDIPKKNSDGELLKKAERHCNSDG